jgi:hypothetical protein
MTITTTWPLKLSRGGHKPTDNKACLLEAVAYVAGEPWSDRPACASPVLITYGQRLNDVLPDDLRQQLIPFIPRIVGTAGDGKDERRSYLALDWLTRTWLPAWLRLVPACVSDADAIAGLPPVVDLESAALVGEAVRAAVIGARAAWGAAGDAAGAAARDAAQGAARAAAQGAAGAAAQDAAGAAAWAAARAAAQGAARVAAQGAAGAAARAAARAAAQGAAGAAARDAARAAARDAARAAAWDAAGAAAWAAVRAAAWDAAGAATWDAAGAATQAALAPTVTELQTSAIALLGTMIEA